MPLYELEEGSIRKFYRVELDGNCVELHWGRIGTSGERQTIRRRSAAEAQAEYDRQISKRRVDGYRLVLDESVPHDAEEARKTARKERLGQAMPLSSSPRFLFVHKKTRRFVWLEAKAEMLFIAEGPLGDETSVTPRCVACVSAPAARKQRDGTVATLLAQGFELVTFDAAEPHAKRSPRPRAAPGAGPVKLTLQRDAVLEGAIRNDPWDDTRWTALEDWLIASGDPRATMLLHEQAGARGDAAVARGHLRKLLFGDARASFDRALSMLDWRAGLLRECRLELGGRAPLAHLETLCDTPAAILLRELVLWMEGPGLPDAIEGVCKAPFASSLRSLEIQITTSFELELDARLLEPLLRLERLAFYGHAPRLSYAPPFQRLERLQHLPRHDGEVAALLDGAFPRLRELVLDARQYPMTPRDLAPILGRDVAPRLETLTLWWVTPEACLLLLEALAASALLPGLRGLSLGGPKVDPKVLAPRFGKAFDHLTDLSLPAAVVP